MKMGGCGLRAVQKSPRIGERGLRAAGRFGRHHENRGRLASTAFDAARGDVRRASPRTVAPAPAVGSRRRRPRTRVRTTSMTSGRTFEAGRGRTRRASRSRQLLPTPPQPPTPFALAPGPHTVTSQSTRQTGRASCGVRGAVGRRLKPLPAWVTDAVVPPRALAAPSASQCTHREAPPRQMVVHESRKVGRV